VLELADIGRARTRRYHRCMVAVSVGLAVVLTAGVVIVRRAPGERVELGGAGQAAGAPEGLTVDGLVRLVAAQPDGVLAVGTFDHRRVERTKLVDAAVDGVDASGLRVVEATERWSSVDQPGLEVVRSTAPQSGVQVAGVPDAVQRNLRPEVAFNGLSYALLRSLPADPAAVEPRLVSLRAEWGVPARSAVEALLDGLTERVVPPAVRAALATRLAQRGLAPLGPATGSGARSGHGFALADDSGVWTLFVDDKGSVQSWDHRPGAATEPDMALVVLTSDTVDRVQAS
jgi:hypothetical protein